MAEQRNEPGDGAASDAWGAGTEAVRDVHPDVTMCPQCGAHVDMVEGGDTRQCPECGAVVGRSPVTRDNAAPPPG